MNYTDKIVHLIHWKSEFEGDILFLSRLEKSERVKIHRNCQIISFSGEDKKLVGVKIRNRLTKAVSFLPLDIVFIYIGMIPQTNFLSEDLRDKLVDDWGYIKVDFQTSKTLMKGLFAVGDVTNFPERQLTTAAASGTIAATSVLSFLDESRS